MNAQETQKFLAKALQYAILIQKLYEKLNKLSLENRKCDIEWKKNIEYVNLVEEQETKLYHSILPTSLIWIISSKKQLAEMFMGKKEKNLVSFYIEGDTCQRQAERRVTSKLNKLPYEGILFGVEISDPSNYIFNDLFKKFWIRIKEKIQDPLIQTMVFRLAYLDEAFESLCIRNDFSIKNTYLPILNKEQEEKYPDDYQYYKKELAIALAFEEFEWLSDQEKFALPMTSKDMLRKEWIKMVYEYISEEDKEELLKMLFETNEGLCQKLNLTPKNSLY